METNLQIMLLMLYFMLIIFIILFILLGNFRINKIFTDDDFKLPYCPR